MWTSPDEARSDLMLSGGVFVLGGVILGTILRYVPLMRVPILGPALLIALPLILTILVPLLLIRYRRESLSDYGFGSGVFGAGIVRGLIVSLPLAAVGAIVHLLNPDVVGLPVLAATASPVAVAARVAAWIGFAGLAVYATVKARDAFPASPGRALGEGIWEIGRILAIVAAVATALLLIRSPSLVQILFPLGVAGVVALTFQSLRGPRSTTTRATLVAPTVIGGLASFALAFDAVQLVALTWAGALSAGIGLVIGSLHESRRSAGAAMAIALVASLLSPLELFRI
ncbi:MAG TPA: hypothetical protein VML96_08930 [Egibacteraceae bacterium]|nr:hypothetical protein [Egibacteraceae bacterium]